MVYGVVQQHDGLINVYSEVGIGTTFKIYLPLVQGPGCESDETVQDRASGGTELILIAEDEPIVRALAVRILEGAGYATLTAADGAEAVELFERHASEISLVLLDVVMPKLTGREVYQQVLRVNPQVGVVFCSGYAPETGQVGCIVEEGLRLVEKPFDPEVLLRAVRDVLDNRKATQVSPCSA
jgi:CheY-like chemotaxis protein